VTVTPVILRSMEVGAASLMVSSQTTNPTRVPLVTSVNGESVAGLFGEPVRGTRSHSFQSLA
jgi:hypothetical protein